MPVVRNELGVSHRTNTSTSTGLVEILDRILDKGLVVAGDIQVKIADIELLTIRIRLIVCSLEKAEELGIDWWRNDEYLSSRAHRKSGSTRRAKAKRQSAKRSRGQPARRAAVQAASERARPWRDDPR